MSGCSRRFGAFIYWLGCAGAAVLAALALVTLLSGGAEEDIWSAGFLALGAGAAWLTGRTVRWFFEVRTRD